MFRGQSFIKGALILTAAGLFVRVIGAVLRIFLAAIMGDEGIGLYQMAYPVYTTLLAISTAGIPIAISKLVAENLAHKDYRGAHRVFIMSLVILTFLGALFSLLLYYGAGFFVRNIVKDPRAYYPLISISPAILLVTVLSAFRGYFQGFQEMMPTAISQIIEQLGRVVVVIVLVFLLLPRGLEFAAAGAAFGAVAGAFLGLLLLLYLFFKNRGEYKKRLKRQLVQRDFSSREVLYRIIALSIPITLGSLVIPLVNMVDLSVVPLRLHEAGYSTEEATALYGQLTGMASSVIQFPLILTIALAMSLVPAISEAQALKNNFLVKARTDLAMRFTLFFSIPASFGLFVLAEPTTLVLFENAPAAYPLALMAFGLIFLSLYTATSGILQGLGYVLEPVKYMILGTVLKIVLSWILTADPRLHIGGAALATVISFLIASLLNIRKVSEVTGWRFNFKELLLKPLTAALFMSWGVHVSYRVALGFFITAFSLRLAQASALFLAIMLGLIIFIMVLFLVGGVREEDLRAIPRLGYPLLKLARRFKLLGR
ncbi:MAG: polysaccharide biosynthesis protein [Dethiobacter sp.]|nr:MAG: polysaccharide biosynthesis protein [Dethiobacter sp.]